MDNLIYPEFESYDGQSIISFGDYNPTLRSPNGQYDISFYQTKGSLEDPERYKRYLKSIERAFRSSKEYSTYKGYLMSFGLDHCQVMGNIEGSDEVDIELHHNILNLFDITCMICEHFLNTIGQICTFDMVQVLIYEHFENRIPICFLSTTSHEMYTNDFNAYIPPEMTFGRWWELIERYPYGITYEIAQKLIRYITKYQNRMPISIRPDQQEQILNFAYYNEFGYNRPMNNYQQQYMIGG